MLGNKSFYNAVSKVYVIAKHMADLHKKVGTEAYLKSPVRTQHVTGNIWFGVNSLGDTDCLARQFRCMSDSLGQKFDNYDNIDYVSESCVNDTVFDFKNTHRVEHTFEVISFVRQFEQDYILGGKSFTSNSIGTDFVNNQVVAIVKQNEQLTAFNLNDDKPFSKYSEPIIYRGENTSILKSGDDATHLTRDELIEVNYQRYANLTNEIIDYNFTKLNDTNTKNLIGDIKKHSMPNLELAVKYHDDMFMLLNKHYHHKLNKRIDPNNKKWYNADDAKSYADWLAKQ
jgi:hypothetical protein